MKTTPSPEQEEIATTVAKLLSQHLPMARVRELAADPHAPALDEKSWSRLAEQGWLALALPESAAGVGLGLPEQVMVFREIGRHLTPGPLWSTALAAQVAHEAGAAELASDLASGQRRAGWQIGRFGLDTTEDGLLLRPGGNGLELCEVAQASMADSADPGARLCIVTPGAVLAAEQGPRGTQRAFVLLAAQLVGIIEAIRDLSADYARTRVQFDRPIGSFQAVKHRCADMAVAAYAAWSQLTFATVQVGQNRSDATFNAGSAYKLASAGARRSTADAIQNFGGIGFTSEHDAHLYLKRALLLARAMDPDTVRQAILAPARHDFD